jgi:outer membrane protein assembly factor BamB
MLKQILTKSTLNWTPPLTERNGKNNTAFLTKVLTVMGYTMILWSPTAAAGTVYIGNNGGHLYAVNATDGTEEWTFDANAALKSSQTVVANTETGDSIGSRAA